MDTTQKKLNDLKKRNPFLAPEGYFEQLTSNVMEQLPEKEPEQIVRVTLMDRVRPWIYMAAVFAGLGLFFRLLVGTDQPDRTPEEEMIGSQLVKMDEEDMYLDFLESSYADDFLLEEIEKSE